MIILHTLDQLATAAKKAAEVKPRLRVIGFGSYEVRGSKGDWYSVTCKKDAAGNRLVFCSCEEKGRRRQGYICYHIVPAVGAHILLAIAQRSVMIDYGNQ
jgi:hypothetical protein